MSEQNNYSVLLVDDDQFLIEMYALKFKGCGCAVEIATKPKVALEKLRGGYTPDIILLDVIMPEMSGFDLLRSIRDEKLAPSAVVVMLTNQGSEEDISQAHALAVDGYLIKASAIPSEILDTTITIAKKKKNNYGL